MAPPYGNLEGGPRDSYFVNENASQHDASSTGHSKSQMTNGDRSGSSAGYRTASTTPGVQTANIPPGGFGASYFTQPMNGNGNVVSSGIGSVPGGFDQMPRGAGRSSADHSSSVHHSTGPQSHGHGAQTADLSMGSHSSHRKSNVTPGPRSDSAAKFRPGDRSGFVGTPPRYQQYQAGGAANNNEQFTSIPISPYPHPQSSSNHNSVYEKSRSSDHHGSSSNHHQNSSVNVPVPPINAPVAYANNTTNTHITNPNSDRSNIQNGRAPSLDSQHEKHSPNHEGFYDVGTETPLMMGSSTSLVNRNFTPTDHGSNEKLPTHHVNGSQQRLALNTTGDDDDFLYDDHNEKKSSNNEPWYKSKKFLTGLLAFLVLAIVIIVIVVPAVVVPRNKHNKNNSSGPGSHSQASNKIHSSDVTGGDGSIIYTEDGQSFRYNNSFGGTWNAQPFNLTARAQSFTPSLIEEWDFNNDRIQGVNLGGWLLLEPFINPDMFEPYVTPNITNGSAVGVVDEWTLSLAMGDQMAEKIEQHYQTFITEHDFAEIAGAGLNWVRIPLGFWAIETWDGEPMLEKVAWKYLLKGIEWARKYGIRVCIDLHAVPGSQNGYNHSGKQGSINFLNSPMGIANAQRTLNYIRTLVEFFSQPAYSNIVPFITVVNEPYAASIGADALRSFYIEAYETIRGITGIGKGKGPSIVFHDGFLPLGQSMDNQGWLGFMQGADRVFLDTHTYLCFTEPNNDSLQYDSAKPCAFWAHNLNSSSNQFGLTIAGEFSLAVNDCGKWLNNIHNGYRYEGTYYIPGNTTAPYFQRVGSCDQWNNWQAWDDTTKARLRDVARGHMDAFRNWFYWTWKTAYSPEEGQIVNPFWNYQLGYRQGYIPQDPRDSRGFCEIIVPQQGLKMVNNPVTNLPPQQSGALPSASIDPSLKSQYPWPPPAIGSPVSTPVSNLPTFTPTGSIITMPVSTPTLMPSKASSSSSLNGWYNAQDTAGFYTSASGCSYYPQWSAANYPVPTSALCQN